MPRRFPAAAVLGLAALALGAAPATAQRGPVFDNVDLVVAVGDLHGAYDEFVTILQENKIIDADLRWSGGKAHLVQIGDVLDRGPQARRIFDLIRRLEGEAAAAGGRVHMLIGNHEAIALLGMTFDYEGFVTVEQFLDFLPDRYRKSKEAEFRKQAGPEADLTPYWEKLARTDLRAQSNYFGFLRDQYGRWIADHDTIIKINGYVFVHGGVSEEYSRWSLASLNRIVSMELLGAMMNSPAAPRVIFDPRGPLWYREDANPNKSEDVMAGEVDAVLANLKASALVVGHTTTSGSRTLDLQRFGGKVWTIDTGIWDPISGRLGALLIKKGRPEPWGANYVPNKNPRGGRGGHLGLAGSGSSLR